MKLSVVLTVIAAAVAVSASEAAAASPSGEPMPSRDLAGWRQIFAEDFKTDAAAGEFPGAHYGANWDIYQDGWWDVTHRSRHSRSILSIDGGILNWDFHADAEGVPLNAVPQPRLNGPGTDPYRGITYGRFSVRLRTIKPANGYGAVFLIWPDNDNWPNEGEINFPGGELNMPIEYTIIRADPVLEVFGHRSDKDFTQWHTATFEWRPGSVKFFVDGEYLGEETDRVPSTPMHWLLQTGTIEAQPAPDPTVTGNLQVDWAAAWAYSPGTPAGPSDLPSTGGGSTRVHLSKRCRKRHARHVSGSIRARFPRGAARRTLRFAGRRHNPRRAIDTTAHTNGLHRLSAGYNRRVAGKPRRVRACAWVRVGN